MMGLIVIIVKNVYSFVYFMSNSSISIHLEIIEIQVVYRISHIASL